MSVDERKSLLKKIFVDLFSKHFTPLEDIKLLLLFYSVMLSDHKKVDQSTTKTLIHL